MEPLYIELDPILLPVINNLRKIKEYSKQIITLNTENEQVKISEQATAISELANEALHYLKQTD